MCMHDLEIEELLATLRGISNEVKRRVKPYAVHFSRKVSGSCSDFFQLAHGEAPNRALPQVLPVQR